VPSIGPGDHGHQFYHDQHVVPAQGVKGIFPVHLQGHAAGVGGHASADGCLPEHQRRPVALHCRCPPRDTKCRSDSPASKAAWFVLSHVSCSTSSPFTRFPCPQSLRQAGDCGRCPPWSWTSICCIVFVFSSSTFLTFYVLCSALSCIVCSNHRSVSCQQSWLDCQPWLPASAV
jgi:hypothetical protein